MSKNKFIIPVTVVCPIYNERQNIEKFLIHTRNFERVIFVDSGSNDGSLEKIHKAGREVYHFEYKNGGAKKRQFALDNLVDPDDWVLLLDADEEVTLDLQKEIVDIVNQISNSTKVFTCKKIFHFMGKRFKFGGFSFRAIIFFKPCNARFEKLSGVQFDSLPMEVHERIVTDQEILPLKNGLLHNDYNGLSHYINKHNHYSDWEAQVRLRYLLGNIQQSNAINSNLFGNTQERRRFLKLLTNRFSFEPLIWFFYHYIFLLGFLEGRRGLIAALIRMQYIQNVKAKLYELRLDR